jgi:hypothetical protein
MRDPRSGRTHRIVATVAALTALLGVFLCATGSLTLQRALIQGAVLLAIAGLNLKRASDKGQRG